MNISNPEQEIQIIRGLPSLATLNGVMLFKDTIDIGPSKPAFVSKNSLQMNQQNLKAKMGKKSEFKKSATKKNQNELDEKDLIAFLTLYDKFSMVIQDEAERKSVGEELGEHMKEVLTDLKINTKNIRHSSIKELHQLKAKYTLCDISKLTVIYLWLLIYGRV